MKVDREITRIQLTEFAESARRATAGKQALVIVHFGDGDTAGSTTYNVESKKDSVIFACSLLACAQEIVNGAGVDLEILCRKPDGTEYAEFGIEDVGEFDVRG